MCSGTLEYMSETLVPHPAPTPVVAVSGMGRSKAAHKSAQHPAASGVYTDMGDMFDDMDGQQSPENTPV
jgi:hypothetical protein